MGEKPAPPPLAGLCPAPPPPPLAGLASTLQLRVTAAADLSQAESKLPKLFNLAAWQQPKLSTFQFNRVALPLICSDCQDKNIHVLYYVITI